MSSARGMLRRLLHGLRTAAWGGRALWLQELPVVALLALAIPLQGYFRQQDAYNYIHELWLLLGLFGAAAAGVAVLYHNTLQIPAARIVAGLLALLALMLDFDARAPYGAGLLGVIVPHSDSLLALLVVLAACWGAGRLMELVVARRWPWWRSAQAVTTLRLLATGIFVTNVVLLANYLQQLSKPAAFTPKDTVAITKLAPTAKRDVYYIVLDRYANSQSLSKHYSYDNTAFLSFLREQGFVVRDDAYSNYQFTAPSMSSTMRMDYHDDIQSALGSSKVASYLPYRRILENSPVSRLFRQAGYQVARLSSWYGVTRDDTNGTVTNPQFAMTLFGTTFQLSDLQSAMIDHTFFAPWFRSGVRVGPLTLASLNTHNTGQLVLDQLQEIEDMAAAPHDQPHFVFAHILSPHPPYVFLPNGSSPAYSVDDNDGGAPRELKYVNQLEFLNSQVATLVKRIKAASAVPPVIIIQADEGPYPPKFADHDSGEGGVYPWAKASTETLQYKYGILAAYYLPDVPDDQKAELNSPVNAFRFVFNHYFTGANLPYLPDCSLLFDGTHPFAFWDATAKLRGTADPACQKLALRGALK